MTSLIKSLDNFSRVFSLIPLPLFVGRVSENPTLVYANESFYTSLGVPPDVLKDTFLNLVSAFVEYADYDSVCFAMGQAAELRTPLSVRARFVSDKHGGISGTLHLVYCGDDEDGTPLVNCMLIDESESIKAVSDIDTRWREFESIAMAIPGGMSKITYKDRTVDYQYLSNGLHGVAGYAVDDAECRSVEAIICDEDIDKYYEEIERQKDYSAFQLVYRVVNKDGTLRWVLHNGVLTEVNEDGFVFVCAYIDINEIKKSQLAADRERERLSIIMGVSDDILFEYNIKNDSMHLTDNGLKAINQEAEMTIENYVGGYLKGNVIHHDYHIPMKSFLTEKGVASLEYLAKTIDSVDEFRWNQIIGAGVRDSEGYVSEVVGIIRDVHEKKLMLLKEADEQNRDQLTKVYTLPHFGKLVEQRLANKGGRRIGAFVFIAVENLSVMSSRLSTVYVGCILRHFAEFLIDAFPQDTIPARISPTVFALFVPNAADIKNIIETSERTAEKYSELYFDGDDAQSSHLSIGIAFSPRDGDTFDKLCERAAAAAEVSRANGGDVTVFSRDFEKQEIGLDTLGTIESEAADGILDDAEAGEVLNLLITSQDTSLSVQVALGTLGHRFFADRVTVYNSDKEATVLLLKYEWRSSGTNAAASIVHRYVDDDDDDDEDIFDLFKSGEPVVVEMDGGDYNLSLHGANIPDSTDRTVALFPILSDNGLHGVVGFMRLGGGYPFSDGELLRMRYMADVIGMYTMKINTKE
ncbi:MAG: PAS domain-containing protein [Oscillospiraceae bacterium]|nr:PAS domain-containing protein [Oscillospiraceae bacterium]